MPRTTPPTPRCKLKWRRSKPSSRPTSGLPHLREDAQVHMLLSYHLRQGHIGINTITTTNVKVKSSTPTTAQRLHHLPGIFAKRLQGIFAYGHTASSPTSTSRLRSREAPQAQARDFHELLRPRHRPRDSFLWDSRTRGVSRVGAPNGRLPQATSSSSRRSSEVRHKKLP